MSLHEKGTVRWVSFPSRVYKNAESGETKYQPLLKIPHEKRWKKFQSLAQAAVGFIINGQVGQEEADVPW